MVRVWSEKDAVLGELEIAAPVERVFRAITDPRELAAWWGAEGVYRCETWKMPLQAGGEWRCEGHNADGAPFHVGGEVVEVDPPHLLVYSWKPSWDVGVPPTLVRWELSAHGSGTRLCIRHTGFGDNLELAKGYEGGWPRVLGWLEEHMQSRAAVN